MNDYTATIKICMSEGLNTLLVGSHGVGKTLLTLEEAENMGLTMKYYSSATLDPWSDLVGIPVPVDTNGSKQLRFIRPADVEDAEILFFDELNRAHPKTINAILEAIQFHSINGVPLPRLKMVWAAINPPDDIYSVNELDPVVIDRFHVHLQIKAEPSVGYYIEKAGIAPNIAKALVMWWQRDLDDNLRQMISPRRLEYMGQSYSKGLDLRYLVPTTVKAPLQYLIRRIEGKLLLPFELTRQTLVDKQKDILSEMESNIDLMLAVQERLLAWPDIVPKCVNSFLAMTSELQAQLMAKPEIKRSLINLGRQGRKGVKGLRPLTDRLIAMGVFK